MPRISLGFLLALSLFLAGCAAPEAIVVHRPGVFVEKPDLIVVRPFAPTLETAKKDADKVPKWSLGDRPEQQTADDIRAGEAASQSIARQIVATMKARGFPVVLASEAPATTKSSVFMTGQFVNSESSTSSLRPAVGFRANENIQTRVQLVQGPNFLGELKVGTTLTDAGSAGASIATQIADKIMDAYVMRGWMQRPPEK